MAEKDNSNVVVQWVSEVVDFSTQYGSETSISYTVPNIVGKSGIYPTYGDFTHACVLRSYGPWWFDAPSAQIPFKRINTNFISQDFIDLRFAKSVFPTKIEIYETFNPGAVVRISACQTHCSGQQNRWVTLWSGEPTVKPSEATVFRPTLKPCPFSTNLIRLEFNQSQLDYYTELDAVQLSGVQDVDSKDPSPPLENGEAENELFTLSRQLYNLHMQDGLNDLLHITDNGLFTTVPGEVIQLIISFLDLSSLSNLAATCQLLRKHAYDPLQYTELNLQPHYTKVTDDTLATLQPRCRRLQRLSLAWCGNYGLLTDSAVNRFLIGCGAQLTSLDLACCRLVDNECLRLITTHCTLLQDLNLQSNDSIDKFGFIHITNLARLQRLNLYRTNAEVHSLICIIRSCPDLEHINLGSCIDISSFDDIAIELANQCRNLKSVDMWRAKSLSEVGLLAFSECRQLQELDLGWCSNLRSTSGCVEKLVQNCPNLKKLFLTANRTICDADLTAIATYCHSLEQLDILGTREISQEAALSVLENCKCLRLFDVSFCTGIDFQAVHEWRVRFPEVSIKKSFLR